MPRHPASIEILGFCSCAFDREQEGVAPAPQTAGAIMTTDVISVSTSAPAPFSNSFLLGVSGWPSRAGDGRATVVNSENPGADIADDELNFLRDEVSRVVVARIALGSASPLGRPLPNCHREQANLFLPRRSRPQTTGAAEIGCPVVLAVTERARPDARRQVGRVDGRKSAADRRCSRSRGCRKYAQGPR